MERLGAGVSEWEMFPGFGRFDRWSIPHAQMIWESFHKPSNGEGMLWGVLEFSWTLISTRLEIRWFPNGVCS